MIEIKETVTNVKNVLIVPGATGLENMAYHPNPIKIKVDENIIWINNDLSIHTVTEGNYCSSIMKDVQRFPLSLFYFIAELLIRRNLLL